MSQQAEKMKIMLVGVVAHTTPPAPSATAFKAATNITALSQTITPTTKELALAVNVSLVLVDTTVSITGGTMTVYGIDQNGVPQSEVFTVTGAGTYTGNRAWSRVDSVVLALTGAVAGGGDETLTVGSGTKMGLPVGAEGELVTVLKDIHNNAVATVGTYNRTYGTVIPANAPNADHDQKFVYTYKVKLQ